MKRVIEYREIQSDHILAVPVKFKEEVVDVSSEEALRKYITKQKDGWGSHYKPASEKTRKMFKVDYTSNAGSVVVKPYKEKRIKKI